MAERLLSIGVRLADHRLVMLLGLTQQRIAGIQNILGVIELAGNGVLDVVDQLKDIAAGHDASGGHRNAARFFNNGAQLVERFKYSVHGYTLHASFHCYQCAWCDCCDRAS